MQEDMLPFVMEDFSSEMQSLCLRDTRAQLDDASKFEENHSGNHGANEANTNGGDKMSTFATSSPTTSCSEFYSSRIASMMAIKSEFEIELEFRTAHSKVHWSELSPSKEASSSEDLGVDHRQYFEKLQKDAHWGPFCNQVTNVVLGKKLGEGAQGDIYEVQVTFARNKRSLDLKKREYVVKLMKGNCTLEDLQRHWPRSLGSLDSDDLLVLFGALVKEPITQRSKMGFVIRRCWGDLRSIIDLRMEHKNAKGSPFSLHHSQQLMYWIAGDMSNLHNRGTLHRDLKASNVLVIPLKKDDDIISSNDPKLIIPYVADWECSVDVVGTSWWRAPEILLQLKNKTPSSKLEFDEKVDVYSFAMTCYEIVTGLIPFEGLSNHCGLRDAILNGARPELPHDLDLYTRAIITSCWDPNPSLQPSFFDVTKIFKPIIYGQ